MQKLKVLILLLFVILGMRISSPTSEQVSSGTILEYETIFERRVEWGEFNYQLQTLFIDTRYEFFSFNDEIEVNETNKYNFKGYVLRDGEEFTPGGISYLLFDEDGPNKSTFIDNSTEVSNHVSVNRGSYTILNTSLIFDELRIFEGYLNPENKPVYEMIWYIYPATARFNIIRENTLNWNYGDEVYMDNIIYTVKDLVQYRARTAWKLSYNTSYITAEALFDKDSGVLLKWTSIESMYLQETLNVEMSDITYDRFFDIPELQSTSMTSETAVGFFLPTVSLLIRTVRQRDQRKF
ncbi:MAG: hypothetical protein INQ03_08050 [Candidatus Heimdallarchaeota archaeon]|nr:hypothetical protein [Candidatus Heimdallarchaeota archaeon]